MTKYILVLTVLSITLTGFEKGTTLAVNYKEHHALSHECVAPVDAERILGLPAKATEHSSGEKNGVAQFKCTYTAVDYASGTSRTSNLYYVYEVYKTPESAHAAYAGIVSSNTGIPGQMKIDSIGDETWLHSDRENFDLIICRKKNHMVRVKINKITGKTSRPALLKFMKETTAKL